MTVSPDDRTARLRWGVYLVLIAVAVYAMRADPRAANTLAVLWRGVGVTIRVTLLAFGWALVIGLAAALARIVDTRFRELKVAESRQLHPAAR